MGWIDQLSPKAQDDLSRHFLEMIRLRLELSAEESIVPMELAMQDFADTLQAAEALRNMAASQRRQESRIREMAEHIEAVVTIIEDRFND